MSLAVCLQSTILGRAAQLSPNPESLCRSSFPGHELAALRLTALVVADLAIGWLITRWLGHIDDPTDLDQET